MLAKDCSMDGRKQVVQRVDGCPRVRWGWGMGKGNNGKKNSLFKMHFRLNNVFFTMIFFFLFFSERKLVL